jgi:hypothetical protein
MYKKKNQISASQNLVLKAPMLRTIRGVFFGSHLRSDRQEIRHKELSRESFLFGSYY